MVELVCNANGEAHFHYRRGQELKNISASLVLLLLPNEGKKKNQCTITKFPMRVSFILPTEMGAY